MAQQAFLLRLRLPARAARHARWHARRTIHAGGGQPVPHACYNYQGGSWKQEGGTYVPDGVFGYFVSVACNHCDDPACVANCPTGAMQKDPDTGLVWTNHEVCIGCKTCATACPYGAPTYGEDEGYMLKCDGCADELARGRRPLCVAACPMRALDFGTSEELAAKYGKGDVEVEPLPRDTTSPNLDREPASQGPEVWFGHRLHREPGRGAVARKTRIAACPVAFAGMRRRCSRSRRPA